MSLQPIVSTVELQELLTSHPDKIIVLHFWEDWAEQCKHVNEALSELGKSEEISKTIKLCTIAAESLPEVSLKYQIKAVPTVVIMHNNKEIDRVEGANIKDIINRIKARESNLIPQSEMNTHVESIDDRLRKLIKAGPCVLFMKGSAKEPKCGFSKQIIGILDKYKADYITFDILQDEEVRQELKRFSNWPTYPQLYLNGELIGGLDIVKEMDAGNELESQLPKKKSLDDRLKMLINQHPVMIFMKGDPTNPRCGFSRTLVEIFKELGVKYDTFDILQDEEVRQGLKTYSNWPTYPQIYVKGDLVGGLDIIKELKQTGELQSLLSS